MVSGLGYFVTLKKKIKKKSEYIYIYHLERWKKLEEAF